MRVYSGMFFRLEEHLDRFLESAKTLGLKVPLSRSELRRRLKKELKDSGKKEAFVRLTLAGDEIFVVVSERVHPPEMYLKGIVLKTTVVRRNPSEAHHPEAKSTSCLNQVLATLDPAPSGTYEILFLNQEGYLTEVRIGNFFMVEKVSDRHGGLPLLITPPAVGLLNGVTRRFVIECARQGKIPVEERPVTRHELFNADEAFLTNTSWEILPIREVDGRKIGSALPGPLTRKLQTLFRQGVERETLNGKAKKSAH
ncbi:MAG: aminotransferase class IV [Candidatus Omnitrophica bacterium]|nr:aminotransferase class IV [Candidatus Omnitrophota bacterium]